MAEGSSYDLSPAEVAVYGLGNLVRGDIERAWKVFDTPLRLALAQGWIWCNAGLLGVELDGRDDLADDLGPAHPGWPAFAAATANTVREWWPALRLDRYAAVQHVVTIDHAQVLVLDTTGVPDDAESVMVPELAVVVRFDEQTGWWVCGFGSHAAEPGWPPDLSGRS